MAHLIHLNGPPGIGKSKLASVYVDRHPGTLNLDVDRLQELVGGWRDRQQDTHRILRPVALAMAAAQLGEGRDVILPQTLSGLSEIQDFKQVADHHGARFSEVVLMDGKDAAIARFDARTDHSVWGRHNRDVVAELGGRDWLGQLYDQLLKIAADWPSAVLVRSQFGHLESTYESVINALDQPFHGAE